MIGGIVSGSLSLIADALHNFSDATPILLGILTLVAMQGDLVWGGVLMFIYGLGSGLPLLLVGHGYERLQPWITTPRRQRLLRHISGLMLLGVGGYVVWSV